MARTKTRKAGATEKQVTEQVLQAAAMLGIELDRRNTGGLTDARGQYVPFNTPGDSDWTMIVPRGPNVGVRLDLEIKAEGFDPSKLGGEKKAHFDRQLVRLQRTNASGGIAFWIDNGEEFLIIMQHVLAGARVDEPGYGRPTVYYPGE